MSPKGIVSDWRYNLVGDLTSTMDFSTATPSGTPPAALQTAFTASTALATNTKAADETVPATGTMPSQETTPVRKRVGPAPAFAQAVAPAAALPEVGSPAFLVAAGVAAAIGVVAANRVRTGGRSDSTRAGGHLQPAAAVALPETAV